MKKILNLALCLMLVLRIFGCSKPTEKDLLTNHYDKLDISMKNVIDEETPYIYEGEYFIVKLKYAVKYNYKDWPNPAYVYVLLIMPKYNIKTVFNGITLESAEYSKELRKLYGDINDSYQALDTIPSAYVYESLEEFIGYRFEYFIQDNTATYGYKMSPEQYESALNNFNIILEINGKKDVINISGFEIVDYNEDIKDSHVINDLENRGIFGTILGAYLKEE